MEIISGSERVNEGRSRGEIWKWQEDRQLHRLKTILHSRLPGAWKYYEHKKERATRPRFRAILFVAWRFFAVFFFPLAKQTASHAGYSLVNILCY